MKSKVKNSLRRRGLARSFRNFRYRWWSRRWGNWLFYNPLDGDWYSYAPQTDAFIPADYLAYDPPAFADGPEDADTGCPAQAMGCPVLPAGDPDVDEPDEPDNDPPDLPGVSDNDLIADGCACAKGKKSDNNSCGCNVCRCNKQTDE